MSIGSPFFGFVFCVFLGGCRLIDSQLNIFRWPGDALRLPSVSLGCGPLLLRANPNHSEIASSNYAVKCPKLTLDAIR